MKLCYLKDDSGKVARTYLMSELVMIPVHFMSPRTDWHAFVANVKFSLATAKLAEFWIVLLPKVVQNQLIFVTDILWESCSEYNFKHFHLI